MSLPSTPYVKLLPLLRELEELQNLDVGYDPEGYAERRRVQDYHEVVRKLDDVFAEIHARIYADRGRPSGGRGEVLISP